MTGWTQQAALKPGDQFTMEGRYELRTLWQWLTRKPKQLKRFKVVAVCESYLQYETACPAT